MKKIFLVTVMLITVIYADFTRDNATQVVTDSTTGLQWQDNVNITKTWTQAIDYCEALTLGGYSDWRLPNFNELYFIADRSKRNPAIDSAFQNVVSNVCWSSSTVVGYENLAWSVHFSNGDGNWNYKSSSVYVRCVRDGQ